MHGSNPSFYNDQDNAFNPSVPVHGPPAGYPQYGGPSPSQPNYPSAPGGYQPPPYNPSPAANTRPSIYPDLGANTGAGNFVAPVLPEYTNVQTNFEVILF